MKVRFGFVAMTEFLTNASPSMTMTLKSFLAVPDREGALLRLTRIAEKNLDNSLRILRHAKASGVDIYRFSSKLIPLYTHQETAGWPFIERLQEPFAKIGQFVRENEMRVSFHPDHFTVLNSPKPDVIDSALNDLQYHLDMFTAMRLGDEAKFVIHIGGGYKDKTRALERFAKNWERVPEAIQHRLTIENDDKTYTAGDAQQLARMLGIPTVFDLHHYICNHDTEDGRDGVLSHRIPTKDELLPMIEPFLASWQGTGLPPKAHMSSPRDEQNIRAHADFVNVYELIPLLDSIREFDADVDIMIEAKRKDAALFKLMRDLAKFDEVEVINGGSINYRP